MSLPDPVKGEPKRCVKCGEWCIITSVRRDEWDPDYVCALCTPEYILAEGRFERFLLNQMRVRRDGMRNEASGDVHDI